MTVCPGSGRPVGSPGRRRGRRDGPACNRTLRGARTDSSAKRAQARATLLQGTRSPRALSSVSPQGTSSGDASRTLCEPCSPRGGHRGQAGAAGEAVEGRAPRLVATWDWVLCSSFLSPRRLHLARRPRFQEAPEGNGAASRGNAPTCSQPRPRQQTGPLTAGARVDTGRHPPRRDRVPDR